MKKIQSINVITEDHEAFNRAYNVLCKVMDNLSPEGTHIQYNTLDLTDEKVDGYAMFDILDVMAGLGHDYDDARKLIEALKKKGFYIEMRG